MADAAIPVAATGSAASANRGCVVDPAQERACLARGNGFSYGPAPFIYCSGVAADMGALSKQHADSQRNQPCVCNNAAEINERRRQCSMVP